MAVDPIPARPFYRLSELAALLGVSDDLLGDEIRDGRLRVRKLRRLRVVTEDDLRAWIAELPAEEHAAPAEASAPIPLPAPAPRRAAPRPRVARLVQPFREAAP